MTEAWLDSRGSLPKVYEALIDSPEGLDPAVDQVQDAGRLHLLFL
jgi:hypothetical protein